MYGRGARYIRSGQNWGNTFKMLGHKLKEAQGYTRIE